MYSEENIIRSSSANEYTQDNNHEVPTQLTKQPSDSERLSPVLLPLISVSRFQNQLYWLDIGCALYSEYEGSEEGLKLWIDSSRKAFDTMPDFIGDNLDVTCKELYCTYDTSYITVKTLAFYARKDSPENYAVWHNTWCRESMKEAVSRYVVDAAGALYHMLWLDYCYSREERKWYIYQQHRWVRLSNTCKLLKFLSTTFTEKFVKWRNELLDNSDVNQTDILNISRFIRRVLTMSFRSNIIKEAEEHFCVENFSSLLYKNNNLTGTNNGVLEAIDMQVVFREGKPEDYISLSTLNDYDVLLTPENSLVQKCYTWLHQAFDDVSRNQFLHLVTTSLLKGEPRDLLLVGNGNNSISCLQRLCCEALGDYCQRRTRNVQQPRSRLNIFADEECDKQAKDAIHCIGTWVTDSSHLNKQSHCYLANPSFYDHVRALAPAFLWILVHEYPKLQ